MKFVFTLLIIGFFSITTQAQHSFKGKIIDGETNQAIPYANVYLAFSQLGSTTKLDGSFELKNIPTGEHVLLVSFVGYKTHKLTFNTKDLTFSEIKLYPDKFTLSEAKVEAKKDKKWNQRLKKFKKIIFGSQPFAKQCEITNPWSLEFEETNGTFSAKSNQILEIENKALGYKINYFLENLNSTGKVVQFNGISSFEELPAKDLGEYKRWEANRRIAYNGSLRHFLKAMQEGTVKKEGFEAFLVGEQIADRSVYNVQAKPSEIFLEQKHNTFLSFPDFLQVNYKREYTAGQIQRSWIKMLNGTTVSKKGALSNPNSFISYGNMSFERLPYHLPTEYEKGEESSLEEDFYDQTVGPFNDYHQSSFSEKIYLHTDKDLYFNGENLWIKAYVNLRGFPSNISNKMKVQLLSKDSIVLETVIPLAEGIGKAAIQLPDQLQSGNYAIKAITNWNNEIGQSNYFLKPIKIGLTGSTVVRTSKPGEVILKLFPEGGEFVNNIENNVAFEIKGTNGEYIDGEVEVYDQNKKLLLTTTTKWMGKGSFRISPGKRDRYMVKVKGYTSEGTELKPIDTRDLGLQVSYSKNNVHVQISSSSKKKKLAHLLVTHDEQIVDFRTAEIEGKAVLSFPKETLKAGINQITLFDLNQKPIAERLIFIVPRQSQDIGLKGINDSYKTREKITFQIEGSDSIRSASISVVDLSQSSDKGVSNIMVNTYLKPEINGSLEGVSDLFSEKYDEVTKTKFDLLMLVNGWRKYDWKAIQNLQKDTTGTIVLDHGFHINGRATYGNSKKPLKDQLLFLIQKDDSNRIHQATTDELGMFSFKNVDYTDSAQLIFRVADTKFNRELHYEFEEESIFQEDQFNPDEMSSIIYTSQSTQNEIIAEKAAYRKKVAETYDFNGKTYYLNEAIIKGKSQSIKKKYKLPRLYRTPNTKVVNFDDLPAAQFNGGIDQILSLIRGNFSDVNIFKGIPGQDSINNLTQDITLVIGKTDRPVIGQSSTRFYINNIPSNPNVLFSLTTGQIETVEVVKGPEAAIFGGANSGGALLVYTKDHLDIKQNYTPDYFQTRLKGYHVYREFYSPDYSEALDYVPDYRTTLYWNPEISNLNREISYYNHDNEGPIKVVLEGFNDQGEAIRVTKTYLVQK